MNWPGDIYSKKKKKGISKAFSLLFLSPFALPCRSRSLSSASPVILVTNRSADRLRFVGFSTSLRCLLEAAFWQGPESGGRRDVRRWPQGQADTQQRDRRGVLLSTFPLTLFFLFPPLALAAGGKWLFDIQDAGRAVRKSVRPALARVLQDSVINTQQRSYAFQLLSHSHIHTSFRREKRH